MKAKAFRHNCDASDYLGVECAWPAPACIGRPSRRGSGFGRRFRRTTLLAALLLALAGAWQLGGAGYIHAKAWLAQVLIEDAWARTRDGAQDARPWPWADTWPVAHLRAPAQRKTLVVLAGASGRTLAFGPGHMFGTPRPGEAGNSVIGAHRDTHFAFLREIRAGDVLELDTARGETVRYRVVSLEVLRSDDTRAIAGPPGTRALTLVTCYPFDALRPGGPLRYVVRAEEDPGSAAAAGTTRPAPPATRHAARAGGHRPAPAARA